MKAKKALMKHMRVWKNFKENYILKQSQDISSNESKSELQCDDIEINTSIVEDSIIISNSNEDQTKLKIESTPKSNLTSTIHQSLNSSIRAQSSLFTKKIENITMTGHFSYVSSLIQLRDDTLASSSFDKTIKIWDLTPYNCKDTLTGYNDKVRCLIELKDGRLASGSEDKIIRLWNIIIRKSETSLRGHTGHVISLTQLVNSKLASGSSDKVIRLWSVVTDQCEAILNGHSFFSDISYSIKRR